MRRRKFLLPFLLILCACTEKVDLASRSDYHDYLAVEATLTDRSEDPQRVFLSRSISYFHNEAEPPVSGASVLVNDVVFAEKEAGVYEAPEGFACETGVDYRLRIRLPEGDTYEAEATMPEPGFRMDAIDYAFAGGKTMDSDSLWTVGVWGYEKEMDSNYLLTHAVNGLYRPFEMAMVSDDKFFNHNEVVGFPITALMQSDVLRQQYGECYKYLEEGDVITLEIWTLEKEYYNFLLSLTMNSVSIPLFTPQPANVPTNIRGEHVLGYFAVCPVSRASVTVDDPFRPYFKKLLPSPFL
ncbi:MAG: DUF4249 domain-containing protein [Bacteroidales bacterium]|nr:DUF4249 domain-containing protein [Bacteroidales bacterium]